MDGNPLPEGFVDLLLQDMVQIRLSYQYQAEAVQGIITVIHQHLQVPQDIIIQILRFINRKDQGLFLVFIQVIHPLLDHFKQCGKIGPWEGSACGLILLWNGRNGTPK